MSLKTKYWTVGMGVEEMLGSRVGVIIPPRDSLKICAENKRSTYVAVRWEDGTEELCSPIYLKKLR